MLPVRASDLRQRGSTRLTAIFPATPRALAEIDESPFGRLTRNEERAMISALANHPRQVAVTRSARFPRVTPGSRVYLKRERTYYESLHDSCRNYSRPRWNIR